jgi:hypothetical protein
MEQQIEQIVSAIISPDNKLREEAENKLETLCREQTQQTLAALLQRRIELT